MAAPWWQPCVAGVVTGWDVSAPAVADGTARAMSARASVKRLMPGILRLRCTRYKLPRPGLPALDRGSCEQLAYLGVRDLREIVVRGSDGRQRPAPAGAHDLVGEVAQHLAHVRRADGYGDHDPLGLPGAHRERRNAHRGARCEPVIHEDHRPPADLHGSAPAPVGVLTALELTPLVHCDARDLLVADAEVRDDRGVQDAGAVTGDRAHRQLLAPRHTELADEVDVQ